jgi:hypothetical protein
MTDPTPDWQHANEEAAAADVHGITVMGVDKPALTQAFRDIAARRTSTISPAADATVQRAMAALTQLRPADREAIRLLLNESAEDGPAEPTPAPPPAPPVRGVSWRELLISIGRECTHAKGGNWLDQPVRVVMPGWVTLLKDAEYDEETGAFTLEPWLVPEAAVAGTPPADLRGVPGGD